MCHAFSGCGGTPPTYTDECGRTYPGVGIFSGEFIYKLLKAMGGVPPCPPAPSSASTPTGPGGSPSAATPAAPPGSAANSSNSNSNSGNGSVFAPCTSTANACGETSTGSVVNGSCNATPPANTACPPPTLTFYASPVHVRPSATSTLHWSATNATVCNLDGGLSLTNLPAASARDTDPITQTTNFTLTCLDGPGGPQKSAAVQITLIPGYKEI